MGKKTGGKTMRDPAFLFYPGDFVNKTQVFTFEEVGIYIRLLILQFNSPSGSIRIEEIKRLLNGSFDEKWCYPISEKFKKDKNGFFNRRLREEIQKRRDYSESRRKNRTKQVKNEVNQETYDKDMINISDSHEEHMEDRNRDINTPKINKEKREELFNLFWINYPKKIGKGKARIAFNKINPNEEFLEKILKAVNAQKRTENWQQFKGKYIPHPTTWLNGEHWENEIEVSGLQFQNNGYDGLEEE